MLKISGFIYLINAIIVERMIIASEMAQVSGIKILLIITPASKVLINLNYRQI